MKRLQGTPVVIKGAEVQRIRQLPAAPPEPDATVALRFVAHHEGGQWEIRVAGSEPTNTAAKGNP